MKTATKNLFSDPQTGVQITPGAFENDCSLPKPRHLRRELQFVSCHNLTDDPNEAYARTKLHNLYLCGQQTSANGTQQSGQQTSEQPHSIPYHRMNFL
jgi:hypothetical protein